MYSFVTIFVVPGSAARNNGPQRLKRQTWGLSEKRSSNRQGRATPGQIRSTWVNGRGFLQTSPRAAVPGLLSRSLDWEPIDLLNPMYIHPSDVDLSASTAQTLRVKNKIDKKKEFSQALKSPFYGLHPDVVEGSFYEWQVIFSACSPCDSQGTCL